MEVVNRKVDAKSRVVLPEHFAGKFVALELVSESEVRVRLAKVPRGRPLLSVLLGGITPGNLHEAVESGPPVGAEQL
jgi:hypothetical protein